MMWVTVLILLCIISVLLVWALRSAFRVLDLGVELEVARRDRAREASLRAATEAAFQAVVADQLGEQLRTNRYRVSVISETTERMDKGQGDGRGPN